MVEDTQEQGQVVDTVFGGVQLKKIPDLETGVGKRPRLFDEVGALDPLGERKLTATEVEQIIEALPPESRASYGDEGKKFLPPYLVQMAVLSDEAKKYNLHADP